MPTVISLQTKINAPLEVCFDLSRSVELHQVTTKQTGEEVVAGRMNGLMERGESVTWQATHFFIKQKLTSKITAFERPHSFTDCMIEGAFKSIIHHHVFKKRNGFTLMTDEFIYAVPYGFAGQIFNAVILKRYMTALLQQRNNMIKQVAESTDYKTFLPSSGY